MAEKSDLWWGVGGGVGFIVICIASVAIESWIIRRGYEFDEQLARATKAAREKEPDAELMYAYARYVEPNGHIRLPTGGRRQSLSRTIYHDGVSFAFRSARRVAVQEPKGMLGAPVGKLPQKLGCRIDVDIRPGAGCIGDALELSDEKMGDPSCGRSMPKAPRCSLAEVWQAAIKHGAPTPALADIEVSVSEHTHDYEWKFTIKDNSKVGPNKYVARITLPDACGPER